MSSVPILGPRPLREVDAHDLVQTRNCVVPNCDGVDAGKSGPAFQGKCAHHCDEVRSKMSEAQHARNEERRANGELGSIPVKQTKALTGPGRKGAIGKAARDLVPHADQLDRTLKTHRQAKGQAKVASENAKVALDQFREAWAEIKAQLDEALA